MATTYSILVGNNEELVISPSELLEQYFFGTLPRKTDGTEFSFSSIKQYIKQAQDLLERELSIKIFDQEHEESFPFYATDFSKWGYVPTSYPVHEPVLLTGFIGNIRQITYPTDWLQAKKSSDQQNYHRRIQIVPNQNSVQSNSVVYGGITPHLGFMGQSTIPEYWNIVYRTGWKMGKVPDLVTSVVAKVSAIPIFAILGDLIIGAGIASQSISIDGLSQSISTTSSATNAGYGARIKELQSQLKQEYQVLKDNYKGINFTVM